MAKVITRSERLYEYMAVHCGYPSSDPGRTPCSMLDACDLSWRSTAASAVESIYDKLLQQSQCDPIRSHTTLWCLTRQVSRWLASPHGWCLQNEGKTERKEENKGQKTHSECAGREAAPSRRAKSARAGWTPRRGPLAAAIPIHYGEATWCARIDLACWHRSRVGARGGVDMGS